MSKSIDEQYKEFANLVNEIDNFLAELRKDKTKGAIEIYDEIILCYNDTIKIMSVALNENKEFSLKDLSDTYKTCKTKWEHFGKYISKYIHVINNARELYINDTYDGPWKSYIYKDGNEDSN